MLQEAFEISEERRQTRTGRKGKIFPTECRDSEKRKEREKSSLSEQCKEIEENNRMEKTRDLFKKMGDIKGMHFAKMDTIKDRICKDLTKAEEIRIRWQEYTEKLYKKGVNDPDNHWHPLEKEMVTHSSILAWKIPWIKDPVQSMGSQRVRHD